MTQFYAFLFFILNFGLSGEAFATEGSSSGYDILLIGGQSNASNSGIGDYRDPLAGLNDDRIFQASCEDANNNSILDLGETSQIISSFGYVLDCFSGYEPNAAFIQASGRVGFALSFARQYAAHSLKSGRKVLIVAAAVPGSGSPAWLQGPGAYLENLLSRTKAALLLPGENRVVAFAWSQGEAEIASVGVAVRSGVYKQQQYDQYKADYSSRIHQLIAKARSALSLPKLPFLISRHAPEWKEFETIKLDFENVDGAIATDVGHAELVSVDGLKSNPLCAGVLIGTNLCEDAAQIHFSAQSHVELGGRFYLALRDLLANTELAR